MPSRLRKSAEGTTQSMHLSSPSRFFVPAGMLFADSDECWFLDKHGFRELLVPPCRAYPACCAEMIQVTGDDGIDLIAYLPARIVPRWVWACAVYTIKRVHGFHPRYRSNLVCHGCRHDEGQNLHPM